MCEEKVQHTAKKYFREFFNVKLNFNSNRFLLLPGALLFKLQTMKGEQDGRQNDEVV